MASLDNSGLISAAATLDGGIGTIVAAGLANSGSIGLITNSGTLAGLGSVSVGTGFVAVFGLANGGSIGSFINSGLVAGYTATSDGGVIEIPEVGGLINGGIMGFVDNEAGGTINGLYSDIANFGSIATLNNDGYMINEFAGGIYNSGSIGELNNTGTIADYALNDSGYIGSLSNAAGGEMGFIGIHSSGEVGGVTNAGTIGGFENSGTIIAIANLATGFIGATSATGFYNDGSLGVLTNLGQISGGLYGVLADSTSSFGTLLNSGSITGGDYGLLNHGTLGLVQNQGLIASAASSALYNNGSIGTLLNSGTIASTDADGVWNWYGGTIGVLANEQEISGGKRGLYNGGQIPTLINNGVISGGTLGLGNIGTLALLQSGGTIAGGVTGIANFGTIATLLNSGAIVGGTAGLENGIGTIQVTDSVPQFATEIPPASISTLINEGAITGSRYAIDNIRQLGLLQNGGHISGGITGILNSGSITSIINSGTISGSVYGINNSGTIGEIDNTGVISGRTGLNLATGRATLVNSGTIIGTDGTAIMVGGNDDLIFTTGSYLEGIINGLTTTNALTLTGTGTIDSDIINLATGSALQVAPGAMWSAEGSWGLDLVTNSGTLAPGSNGGSIGAPLTITGNFTQSSGGELLIVVAPGKNAELEISGSAGLDGAIDYEFAPGIYQSGTYTVITSGTMSGSFASELYNSLALEKGVTITTVYLTDPGVDLVLNAPAVVQVPDAALFAAQNQALAQSTQADTSLLLQRALQDEEPGAPPQACGGTGAAAGQSGAMQQGGEVARLEAELANGFCAAGGWLQATGNLFNAGSGSNANSYNANSAGFLAGIDKPLNALGTRLGLAFGYDHMSLTERGAGAGSSAADIIRVALYGAQPVGRVTLTGVLDYGHASGSITRNSGMGNFRTGPDSSIFGGGLQASLPVTLGPISLVPAVGLRFASVSGGAFAEPASGDLALYAVSGKTPGYVSTQPYASLWLDRQYETQSGLNVNGALQLGYMYEAGDTGLQARTTTYTGTVLGSGHNHLAPNAGVVGASLSLGRANWALYADYNATAAANWTAQTAEFGLHVNF
jgi:hypothetical protein